MVKYPSVFGQPSSHIHLYKNKKTMSAPAPAPAPPPSPPAPETKKRGSKTRKTKAPSAAPVKRNRPRKCVAQQTPPTTTSPAIACADQPVIYADYIKNAPDLLLAYFYHLRSDCTKYIAFGYNSKTFEPTIILHHIGNTILQLSALEFTSIFLQADSIQSFFNPFLLTTTTTTGATQLDNQPHHQEPPNRYMHVEFQTTDDANRIIIQRLGNTQNIFVFTLEESEWIRIYELLPFFNPLIFWYKSTLHSVKTYYDHYIKLCTDCNTVCLTVQQFFSPNDIPANQNYTSPQSPSFNYSRLFHEISFMCRQDIVDNVLTNLYTSTN